MKKRLNALKKFIYFCTHQRYYINPKLSFKIYFALFWDYIICNQKHIRVTFKEESINSFSERIFNLLNYYFDKIYRFFIYHFIREPQTTRQYEILYYPLQKPKNYKLINKPDEKQIKKTLSEFNYIIDEVFIFKNSIIYKCKENDKNTEIKSQK